MQGTLRAATASPEETRRLGSALAGLLDRGDVVSLTGDLGAGKTTLVQGIAAGLGVEQAVLSPTFTLLRQYEGRMPIYHLDVYRLERVQEVFDLGFEDIVGPGTVVLIEWGDAIDALLPESRLEVELTMPADDGVGRRLALSARGHGWGSRWQRLADALQPWTAGDG